MGLRFIKCFLYIENSYEIRIFAYNNILWFYMSAKNTTDKNLTGKKRDGQAIVKKMLDIKKAWTESSCDSQSIKKLENKGYTFAKFK